MRFNYIRRRPIVFMKLLTAIEDMRPVDALLDTGATLSIFPSSLAKPLGIDLQLIEPVPVTAANQTQFSYRPAKVDIRLANVLDGMAEVIQWPAVVGFSEECKSGVLGHRECLDYFEVSFHGDEQWVSLVPNSHFPGSWFYKKLR